MTTTTTITKQDPQIEAYRLGLLEDTQGLIRNEMFGQQVQNLRAEGLSDEEIAQRLSMPAEGVEGEEGYLPALNYSVEDIAAISPDAQFGMPDYRVAGLTTGQQQAIEKAEAGVGSYKPYLAEGLGDVQAGKDYTEEAITSMGTATDKGIAAAETAVDSLAGAGAEFSPDGITAFMNPYEQEVIDRTIADLRSSFDSQQAMRASDIAAKAVSAGAYGQSGFERARARELDPRQEAFEKSLASTVADLRMQGYQDAATRAQTAFESGKGRTITAASTEGQLGLGIGELGQAGALGEAGMADQLSNQGVITAGLGELEANLAAGDINNLMTTGGMEQANEQAILDAQRLTDEQNYQEPYKQLGFLSDVYAGIPTSQSTQTMSSGSNASPFMQAASAGIAGLSAYGGAKQAGIL